MGRNSAPILGQRGQEGIVRRDLVVAAGGIVVSQSVEDRHAEGILNPLIHVAHGLGYEAWIVLDRASCYRACVSSLKVVPEKIASHDHMIEFPAFGGLQ